MSITAELRIDHERLSLAPTLRRLPEIEIRVVSEGTTDPESTVFPFVIEYGDRDELEEVLDTDETVETYELIDWVDQTGIYYIEHTPETKLISTAVTNVNGFMLHAQSKDHGWIVRLLLPDRRALNTIWEYAGEHDITVDIIEMYGNEDAGGESSYGLTDAQRIALTTAYEHGYFNEPRDVSLDAVADELGLSSTAMSGRLRRGMRNLIAATLAESDGEE